ncbi:MAG: apolipoprotein N-acyltransferase [Bacteroidetes bacterium]|nr:apolipoprotein N-acyltransferase [Bacteroidota bacterium]
MPRGLFRASILSGILLGASFPIDGLGMLEQGWLAMIAYVPLLRVTVGGPPRSPGHAFALALLTHLLAYSIAFHWVILHPLPVTALASVGGVAVVALLTSIPWAVGAWVRKLASYRLAMATWALSMLGLEHMLSVGPWAVPWSVLSHTQASMPHAELASIAGGTALTAIVIAMNAAVTRALGATGAHHGHHAGDRDRSGPSRPALVPIAALAVVIAAGSLISTPHPSSDQKRTRLLLVQPAMQPLDWARTDTLAAVDRLLAMTEAAMTEAAMSGAGTAAAEEVHDRPGAVDAIVWPETALPPLVFRDTATGWQTRVDALGAPLVTGAVRPVANESTSQRREYTNDVLLFQSDGRRDAYSKHHLVPFAEHVPFVDDLPMLQRLTVPAGGVAGYRRGNGASVLPVGDHTGLRIAPLVCFETILRPYARSVARLEPDILLGLSQVGWWGNASVLPQYRALTSLRARETGYPMLVATVSGSSFTAHPDGRLEIHANWMDATAKVVSVPEPVSTRYRAAGAWMDGSVALLLAVVLLLPTGRARGKIHR